MNDNRKDWELKWNLLLNVALEYLPMLVLERPRARVYEKIYNCHNGGIKKWANEHIERLVEEANELVRVHGQPGYSARAAVDGYRDRLVEAGFAGAVLVATTQKETVDVQA